MAQIMLRLPDEDATKMRMIASAHNVSMNAFIHALIRKKIQEWESEYGELPLPPASKRVPSD